MKILIAGRTGSGKDFIAKQLSEKLGLTLVKSYTTRPKRSDNDNSHIFVTDDEADKIENKIGYTEVDGYKYFSTKETVENSDMYIVDVPGIVDIPASMPDTSFMLLYVSADSMTRKLRVVERHNNALKAEEIFEAREEFENDAFTELENTIEHGDTPGNGWNVFGHMMYANNADGKLNDLIGSINSLIHIHKNLMTIIKKSAKAGILINYDENSGKLLIDMRNDKTSEISRESMSIDTFSGMMISKGDEMNQFIESCLSAMYLE